MNVIGIDYGTSKIGVAVGNTQTSSSSPLEIIINTKSGINWTQLETIIQEWKPQVIIVGQPFNMDGSESEMMKEVKLFADILKERINIKIEFFDERLTSFEAKQMDTSGKPIDDLAAKIILDGWLSNNVHT
ncbi:MAG: Holliday junction resolvase RuvX [Pseudomonadota bacterium]|nr:Holliday junction resolvase RuvX [Pseudomonadota bacterium]